MMLGTFSLHKIDHAIRDLEQKVAHGAEISREELASGLRITKHLRDELEVALKVIDGLKDHTGPGSTGRTRW
ncbi:MULTISPECIES: hypothetical protein [Bradyrhizobium]|jgi:hypothetical protein|uniref:Uncharacterized protein n=5 Tax=Bradyrhizobium TaxID=374 RepID=A0A0A3YTA6_BRAJP|nr:MULTISPECIES: hypothetical protein [Bradyrhizobium]AND87266.1 hypothetical protein AAV28_05100 [Bradyrhizobium diazoefficiens USDA 110]AJA65716.1 hypothetical protein RN69_39750 [Bradyrhizobium japonicum]APG15360.1 hypothetical protein BKD09_44430 [Bradyrhizobium japonicum]APO50251.1 hypothetical protein BD122_08415 [Bradyrhizobium diazoefficiens]KGJ66070.1 hypothetical protein BJA5080_02718 [Bradyrhizobium diazoefficiens SEMIA 5080]